MIKNCPYCGSKRLTPYRSMTTTSGFKCRKCEGNFEVVEHIAPDECCNCGKEILGKRSMNSVRLANGKVKHNRCRKVSA